VKNPRRTKASPTVKRERAEGRPTSWFKAGFEQKVENVHNGESKNCPPTVKREKDNSRSGPPTEA